MRALITGVAGFAGSHLVEYLLSQNVEVAGVVYHSAHSKNLGNNLSKIKIFSGDLNDSKFVNRVVREFKPDHIYHLAAQASAAISFADPESTLIGNIRSQLNILEAVRNYNLVSRILITGSAEEYGIVALEDIPIDENTPFKPIQPYAVSKIGQDFLGYQYFLTYKLNVIRVRPFNHIGPRQRPDFAVADFCSQIAQIKNEGKDPVVFVGNLDVKRDFSDVRDIVRAYYLALEKGTPGEVYNLGCGQSYKIGWILDKLIEISGLDIKIEVEQKRLRPVDIPETVCDFSKFEKATGWKPKYKIEDSLKYTLDFYLNS